MTISICQIHPVFVGEVSGVDLARPLAPDEVAAIEAGMDRYAVLVFHDQKITDEQQMAFSRRFGALEDARGGTITKPEDKRLQTGMNDVSNLGRDGLPMPEARILLKDLNEHATQPTFVYVHHWCVGDLVMWDNRQMMHRVRRYDESQPRDMRRTTVAGDAATTAQI